MDDLHDLWNHPVLLIVICAIWAWVSITLVIRLWLMHRRASFVKKFLWSLMLLVPVFGWMCYGGFFRAPESQDGLQYESYDSTMDGPG